MSCPLQNELLALTAVGGVVEQVHGKHATRYTYILSFELLQTMRQLRAWLAVIRRRGASST